MIISTPGPLGQPEHYEIPAADLAREFWASSWGLRASQEAQEATPELLGWLTSPKMLGGVQASWSDSCGLRELRDLIARQRAGHG